jgi:hypothetical protein
LKVVFSYSVSRESTVLLYCSSYAVRADCNRSFCQVISLQVYKAMFRIRDILVQILIFRCVHWITDREPDPALFFSGFKDANKDLVFVPNFFFASFFLCL